MASYKEGRENFVSGSECISEIVGKIPKSNMKKYGKNILIKAQNEGQAMLLTFFHPPANGNISSMTPHKTFNTKRGVVYCKDLYEFEEEDILERCPDSVCNVRKLKGVNHAILLTFTSLVLPDYIWVNHTRLKVKKFRVNPTQCYNCFQYGHVSTRCNNAKRCYICSQEYADEHTCLNEKFCMHCSGNHNPNSRQCERYKFEQEVVETAENEHVSFGTAKRIVMAGNKSPEATYAKVIKMMRTKWTFSACTNDASAGRASQPTQSHAASSQHTKPRKNLITASSPVQHTESNEKANTASSHETDNPRNYKEDPPTARKEDMPSTAAKTDPPLTQRSQKSSKSLPSARCMDKTPEQMETEEEIASQETTHKSEESSFRAQPNRGRVRPRSPEVGSNPISTSNSFSELGNEPESKKLAVSTTASSCEDLTECESVKKRTERFEAKHNKTGQESVQLNASYDRERDDKVQSLSSSGEKPQPSSSSGKNSQTPDPTKGKTLKIRHRQDTRPSSSQKKSEKPGPSNLN